MACLCSAWITLFPGYILFNNQPIISHCQGSYYENNFIKAYAGVLFKTLLLRGVFYSVLCCGAVDWMPLIFATQCIFKVCFLLGVH
jgi:hypothetical protein